MARGKKKKGGKTSVYEAEHRREKNKVRDLRKYLKSNPNNSVAAKRLAELEAQFKI